MKAWETPELAAQRWAKLELVQKHYSSFIPFLQDVMAELGFDTSEIQEDIAGFIAYGPASIMVQAQRSQAKTTIAAAYAVWSLIHDPTYRVLIISAGGTQAEEISTLIVRIVMNMDVLECLRPDKLAGDRTSVLAFDVHHSLKGMDKSPSVACVGIDSNLQGKRADLLIPDDIESSKNSATATQRAKLLHLTKDFTSIVVDKNGVPGRTIWLGTPQTMESIYNSLPGRGVTVRIWPGRYPTVDQLKHYGNNLAPYILNKLARNPELMTGGGLLGDQGQPVDTVISTLNEEGLQKKERDQGTAYFQLQHMLNTALMDSMRNPLKLDKLCIINPPGDRFPLTVIRGMLSSHYRDFAVHDFGFKLTEASEVSNEVGKLQQRVVYIDPAGGGANGDETAYAMGGLLNSNIHLVRVGGMPGGYEEPKLEELAKRIAAFKPDVVKIEKNMGHGAFRAVFAPILRKYHQCGLEDDLVTGQKERRIISTLEPIMGRGALIVSEAVIREDSDTVAGYAPAIRLTYSFFYQMAKLSAVRESLIHDDRLDAVEGLCRHFQEALAVDQNKEIEKQKAKAHAEAISDPLGYNRYSAPKVGRPSMLRRRR